jgi:hypothetical protein
MRNFSLRSCEAQEAGLPQPPNPTPLFDLDKGTKAVQPHNFSEDCDFVVIDRFIVNDFLSDTMQKNRERTMQSGC